ncbi:MAG: transposase family protein, partial [bacterium]
LNAVNGQKSFLTMIDMYTGFVIAVPLKSETTPEIAKIVENYLIKIFGPPSEISSDNAANLTGPAIKKLCAFYNIKYRNTVPYSPTSHALVEIANRYIVQLMRIFSDQFQT